MTIRWNALSSVRLGLIDRRTTVALGRFPEIGAVIVDRLSERAQRLAVTQAISQLNRVDRRLLALFWHLAERWGRVARDGIAVPLVLSHRLIGELVGARRPTVSTALAELARDGQLVRREDGTWLLTGEPVAVPMAAEVVRQRRRLMPTAVEEDLERRAVGPARGAAVVAGGRARGRPPPPREPRRPAGRDRGAARAHRRAARAPPAPRRRAARRRRAAPRRLTAARRLRARLRARPPRARAARAAPADPPASAWRSAAASWTRSSRSCCRRALSSLRRARLLRRPRGPLRGVTAAPARVLAPARARGAPLSSWSRAIGYPGSPAGGSPSARSRRARACRRPAPGRRAGARSPRR